MAGFEFVNVARPGDVKQHSTQIRRHVMKDIGKARRKPRPKKHKHIILGEGDADAESAKNDDDEERRDATRVLARPNPQRDGSISMMDFPIDMDEERMGLVRFSKFSFKTNDKMTLGSNFPVSGRRGAGLLQAVSISVAVDGAVRSRVLAHHAS